MKVVYINTVKPKLRIELYNSRSGATVSIAARRPEQAERVEQLMRAMGLRAAVRRNRYEYRVTVRVPREMVGALLAALRKIRQARRAAALVSN